MQFVRKIIAALLLLVCAGSSAFASTVSRSAGEGAGMPLRWRTATIQIGLSASLFKENPNIIPGSDVAGAIKRSFEAWERVANIELIEFTSDRLNASPAGITGDGVSLITIAPSQENVLLFTRDPELVAATTRVFFNQRGQITEADIVLNPYQQFSTDGSIGTFDLESTLTHELGHLLGLDHSPLLGATMHENYGKNGIYGLQNFGSRFLAAGDIAAARAIYGPKPDAVDCCGRVAGKLAFTTGRVIKNAAVWIEDAKTGSVHGETRSGPDGGYRFAGLPRGTYKIFAQGHGEKTSFPAQEVAELSVDKGETAAPVKRITSGSPDVSLSYLGFNGQLSDLPVPLTPGRSYVIYIGGENLDPKTTRIGFSSPHLSLIPVTVTARDFGSEVSVLSFEVRVDPRAPDGEFSIFVESEKGHRSVLVGGLTIDGFANPWSSYVFFGD